MTDQTLNVLEIASSGRIDGSVSRELTADLLGAPPPTGTLKSAWFNVTWRTACRLSTKRGSPPTSRRTKIAPTRTAKNSRCPTNSSQS